MPSHNKREKVYNKEITSQNKKLTFQDKQLDVNIGKQVNIKKWNQLQATKLLCQ